VVVGTDPPGVRGIAGLFAHRAVLRLHDAADVDLPDRAVARSLPSRAPGRAYWLPAGCDVQVPVLDADPAGPGGPCGPPAGDDLIRLDPLPDEVGLDLTDAPAASALLGIGGDRLAPVYAPVPAGASLLVTGPRGSGRSTALATVAASLAATGARVVLVARTPHETHAAAGAYGVRVVRPAELDTVLADVPDVVAVDDARGGPHYEKLLATLDTVGLVVAASGEDLDDFTDRLLRTAVRAAAAKILLSPGHPQDASRIKEQIGRDECFAGPPGRAYVFAAGRRWTAQVPTPVPVSR
jgi:S-DNA-T family DNA segregation ATPase FtsK/SpoIIIE